MGARVAARAAGHDQRDGTVRCIAGTLGGGNYGAGRRSEGDPNLVCETLDANGVRAAARVSGRLDPDKVDPRPDAQRYFMMGNAVTVNVAEWIGRRIVACDDC